MVLLPGHMRVVEPAVVAVAEVIEFSTPAQERGDLSSDLVACLENEDIPGAGSLSMHTCCLKGFMTCSLRSFCCFLSPRHKPR